MKRELAPACQFCNTLAVDKCQCGKTERVFFDNVLFVKHEGSHLDVDIFIIWTDNDGVLHGVEPYLGGLWKTLPQTAYEGDEYGKMIERMQKQNDRQES